MNNHECPRRVSYSEVKDTWREDNTCSYCGSISPERFLEEVKNGTSIGPTDKNYKVYVQNGVTQSKFYFQHLSENQKQEFVSLLNRKKVVLGMPSYFYVMPYFISLTKQQSP